MRCPSCGDVDDRVVDSRMSEDGTSIRRRRLCAGCGRRFTTFERIEEAVLVVRKSNGLTEPFDAAKIIAGVRAAAKGRPLSDEVIEELAHSIAEEADGGGEVTSAEVGRRVLEKLRTLDQVAYLRFASVYKAFQEGSDFERELGFLAKVDDPPETDGAPRSPAGEDHPRTASSTSP